MKAAIFAIALAVPWISLADDFLSETNSGFIVEGIKYPNSPDEGQVGVRSRARVVPNWRQLKGFNSLLKYVSASPNQEDAGTCLYMSLTGITEWWMNRLHSNTAVQMNGANDFSERFLVNLAGSSRYSTDVVNWRTDSIFVLNRVGYAVRNRDYRFAKGWYRKIGKQTVHARSNENGASYGTPFNWIDDSDALKAEHVELPRFEREILFADPGKDVWNVGGMPSDIVERVKTAMKKRMAPVHVIYNHMGYWHAVNIVGFDDALSSDGCAFVEQSRRQFAQGTTSEGKIAHDRLEQAYRRGGGCHPRGMFYVRDSIYPAASGPLYDFDPTRHGEEGRLSESIILHEYDWLTYLGNHATQIYVSSSQALHE